jgi:hypothetical protein
MLGRAGDPYDDGSIPQATEAMAWVVQEFTKSSDAQQAWARIGAREGYRPIPTTLGFARPLCRIQDSVTSRTQA